MAVGAATWPPREEKQELMNNGQGKKEGAGAGKKGQREGQYSDGRQNKTVPEIKSNDAVLP